VSKTEREIVQFSSYAFVYIQPVR